MVDFIKLCGRILHLYEDTEGETISRKSENDRQYNDRQKMTDSTVTDSTMTDSTKVKRK